MIRTQVSLTADQMERAQAEARRRGVSVAALVRDALERLLREDRDEAVRERARRAVGGFRSGTRTTSTDHDEALAKERRW